MKKEYAVFDWDNTVRDGFTLFDWIDYLIEQGILHDSIRAQIDEFSFRYSIKQISHDEYAHLACKVYAKEIRDFNYIELKKIARKYIARDREKIYSGMDSIFNLLHQNKIDIIIISGAPRIVLDYYKKDFHIRSVRAFKERVSMGYLNGQVAYNYGYNKCKAMMKLESEYGNKPLFGFGDSNSDIPILEEATYAFSINNSIGNATRIDTIDKSVENSHLEDTILQIIRGTS